MYGIHVQQKGINAMSPSKKTPSLVREPVQVYLDQSDRALLDKVARKSGLSRAEILRRGVRRMAAELLADESPMLRFIHEQTPGTWPVDTPADAAEHHDRYLTDAPTARRKPPKRS
jgi:hypothetical protein